MSKLLIGLTIFCFALSIAFLVSTNTAFAAFDQGSFVGAWLFDEGNGQDALDLTGNTGTGKLVKDPKWVDGVSGKALDFDGKDDYVEIKLPEVFSSMSKNDFTITYWINVQNIAGSGTVWTRILEARFDDSNYLQFDIQINDGELGINVMVDASEVTFITDPPIKSETWYYVTCTWEASTKAVKLYLDGVLQTKAGATPASPGKEKILNLGRRSDGSVETYFDGIIDEFAVLNVAITEDDIKALMDDGLRAYAAVSSQDKLATAWGNLKSY